MGYISTFEGNIRITASDEFRVENVITRIEQFGDDNDLDYAEYNEMDITDNPDEITWDLAVVGKWYDLLSNLHALFQELMDKGCQVTGEVTRSGEESPDFEGVRAENNEVFFMNGKITWTRI